MNCMRTTTTAFATLAVAGFLLTGCGTASGPATGAARTPAAADNGGGDAGGGGAEAAGTRFVSTRFHYRVDAPGTMTEATDGTATASRGGERMSIRVISGAAAADLKALSTTDLNAARAASPNYRPLGVTGSVMINGRTALKAVYQWTDGTSPVTGRPLDLTTVRYVIPRDSNTAAVLAYSIITSQYDPQGADDVASTFAWQ